MVLPGTPSGTELLTVAVCIMRLTNSRKTPMVSALLFDLDGTLIDTEEQTDDSIARVVAAHGVPGFSLPASETHGRTWNHIANIIIERTGLAVPPPQLIDELQSAWNLATDRARFVPGAAEALRAAARAQLALSVVSSSPRLVINRFLDRLGVADLIGNDARIGGDDVTRGKPEPQGYIEAASRLGIAADQCLVFEDSLAGLQAAQAAGMRSMYVTCCAGEDPNLVALATARCTDYQALPATFWSDLHAGQIDLAGRAYS
jgi:HAD superfamily hydrolase (TIGR01509 family)